MAWMSVDDGPVEMMPGFPLRRSLLLRAGDTDIGRPCIAHQLFHQVDLFFNRRSSRRVEFKEESRLFCIPPPHVAVDALYAEFINQSNARTRERARHDP